MKVDRKIFFLPFLCSLLLSCGSSSSKHPPVYIDSYDDDDDIEASGSDTAIIYKIRSTIYDSPSLEDETTARTVQEMDWDEDEATYPSGDLSLPATIPSREFYQGLLEAFCQEYYDIKYSGRHYKTESLRVDRRKKLSDNSVEVWGTHSYEGRFQVFPYDSRDFKAIIQQEAPHQYKIIFTKKSEIHMLGINLVPSFNESIEETFNYNVDP